MVLGTYYIIDNDRWKTLFIYDVFICLFISLISCVTGESL